MRLKTRFGKKLEGKALKNLTEALGEKHVSKENSYEFTGRASVKLTEKGFDVEVTTKIGLYFNRHNYSILRGVIPYSPKLKEQKTETEK